MKKFIDIRTSLTARIFLMTVLILLAAVSATYLFIAWATPRSYKSIATDELSEKADELVKELQNAAFESCEPIVNRFSVKNNLEVVISDDKGETVLISSWSDGTSQSTTAALVTTAVAAEEDSGIVTAKAAAVDAPVIEDSIAMSSTYWDRTIKFVGSDRLYELSLVTDMSEINQTTEAMRRVLPHLILVMFVLSLSGAFLYSHLITRPIVRLTRISRKLAALDFTWKCTGTRRDEIGVLERNMDELSNRLASALDELKEANVSLKRDIEREREREQQRSAFFAAASHELKTPVTVLKGQISGMLAGVDIYRDRDKYLARSLAVTGRMEKLVQEMLTIARMEKDGSAIRCETLNLSELIRGQADVALDLAGLREQQIFTQVEPDVMISGDPLLLGRAVSNLLANALNHSPEEALVWVRLTMESTGPVLEIENSGSRIPKEALSQLFEPFYRVDVSRSRETGGSGLGLYLVKMILDRHGASCRITNTAAGVAVTVCFLST